LSIFNSAPWLRPAAVGQFFLGSEDTVFSMFVDQSIVTAITQFMRAR